MPANTWSRLASSAQGGGAGILRDFLFGDYTRFGNSPIETLPGPAFGAAADIATLFSKSVCGEVKAADSVKFGAARVPFVNLFRLAPRWNYGVVYSIQESLNPGCLRRMDRVEQQNNQRFWLPPSELVR